MGALVNRINPKILVAAGFSFLALSGYLSSRFNLQMSMSSIIGANLAGGIGTSCIFVPLTTLAIGTLRNEQIGNGAGLQNLVRNIGGSIGLSFVSTMLQRYSQTHQAMLVGQLSSLNPQYQSHLAAAQHALQRGFSAPDALARANSLLYHQLLQQSSYWAFVNLFFVVSCICVACVLCVPIFSRPSTVHAVTVAE